jgi:DNA-binding NarL/FixJ family response regulator
MELYDASILLVEDDSFARTALEGLVKNLGFKNVVLCDGVSSAMSAIESFAPSLAIVDLDLGEGPNGIDLVIALRRRLPDLGIVVLTTYSSPRLLGVSSMQIPLGVVYLVKSDLTTSRVLLDALTQCWENGAKDSGQSRDSSVKDLATRLSDQQIDIMRLIAHGHSNSEIALRLFVNERTVEKSISRLIKTLNLNTDKTQNQRVRISQAYFGLAGLVRRSETSF